jgi:hypothetical protein
VTLAELRTRTLKRLAEDPAAPVYFTAAEVTAALNRGQRLFAFATLCLESIETYYGASAWQSMLPTFPAWLLPVRVRTAAGAKVHWASLRELDALDENWEASAAAPARYGCLGFDLLYLQGRGTVSITFAREPAEMVEDGDEAEIPDAYQPTLIDYAIGRVRAKQGGQEFTKALPYFERFLAGMKSAAADTRARAVAQDWDRRPFEGLMLDPKLLAELESK